MTLPVNKPVDWTSFDVVNKLRHVTRFKKVGHAGTLDPFAEGVLILGFGKHTKELDRYKGEDKIYRVDIELGKETDTQDREGQVVKSVELTSPPSLNDIQTVLEKFKGDITQIPPMYSAKKVKGERLYKLAREGKIIERDPIRIKILSLDVIDYTSPILSLRVICSTGTYIRTLAADIGKELGCGAYALNLVREQVGGFTLDEAYSIEAFIEAWTSLKISKT